MGSSASLICPAMQGASSLNQHRIRRDRAEFVEAANEGQSIAEDIELPNSLAL